MSLNQNFLVKNSINTLGQYLSSGTDIATLLSPYVTYTIVSQNSASWGNGGGLYTAFQNQSANNISVYSSWNANSAYDLAARTFVNNNSANILTVDSTVNTTSANWNSVYSYVNTNSATNSPSYNQNTYATYTYVNNGFLPLSGGAVTGFVSSTDGFSAGYFRATQGIPNTADQSTNGYAFGSDGDTGLFSPIVGSGGSGNGIVAIYTNNQEQARFIGSNKVGFGTTTPNTNLTVSGNISASNTVYDATGNSNQWNSVYSLINSTTGTNFKVKDLTVNGNLTLSGTLFLQGSAVYENTNSLTVESPIIYLAEQNPSDDLDIGIVGHNVVGGVYGHTGLLRTHGVGNPGTWYLFSSMTTEPSANSVATNSKVIDTLVANTSGSHTGNASTATTLQNARNFSLGSGDVTSPTISFNGSSDVAFVTTIQSNVVTYSKIQQVGASKILGNPTGSTANVSEIPASTTGFALISASSAAAGATTLGLGTTNSVTHNDLTVGSTSTSNLQVYTGSVTSNNTLTVPTFSKSGSYKTGKYTVQVKNTSTSARAALEILVTYNGAAASWDGTFYGIIDSSNIFSNVDVSTSGSTVDLVFTFNGNSNYSVTVLSQALTD